MEKANPTTRSGTTFKLLWSVKLPGPNSPLFAILGHRIDERGSGHRGGERKDCAA
jgi:hypothetical protein